MYNKIILRDIYKNRTETKMKGLEVERLAIAKDSILSDLKTTTLQNDHLREQLLVHQKEFLKLEQQANAKMKQLKDELCNKTDQLQIYLQEEIRLANENKNCNSSEFVSAVCDPCKRLQQIVELTRKCSTLMKSEEKLQDQLKSEKKIVSEMALSIKDMEISFKEATTPMAKVVEEKDDETCRLKFENIVMIGKIATLQEK